MHILPILSTLRRHRTAAALIVLEIALTCAIVCNAIFLISDRLDAHGPRRAASPRTNWSASSSPGIGKRRRTRCAHRSRTSPRCARFPACKSAAATNHDPVRPVVVEHHA